MRFQICATAMIAGVLCSPAAAAGLPNEAPDGQRWMSCFVRLKDTGGGFNRPIALGGYWLIDVPANESRKETNDRLRDQWISEYLHRIPTEFPGFEAVMNKGSVDDARCNHYGSRGEWKSFVAHVKDPLTSDRTLRSDFVPSFARGWVSTREHAQGYNGKVATSGGTTTRTSPAKIDIVAPQAEPRRNAGHTKEMQRQAEEERLAEREARERDFQAKVAAHQAEVAAYQDKVEARRDEIARQQREHAAAQQDAARKKAEHARLIEEHTKRQMEYEAARHRHTACVNGDQSACADIAAGKSTAAGAKMAEAGKASTDTDATRCVTSPEVFPSRVWKNTTEARVVNNCETAVDIVICLNRAEGWHCGVKFGVSPGAGMSWDARNGNGQVFWDARVIGSTKPLGRPS